MLEHWVGNERFPDFIHFTRGNLHQVFSERGNAYNQKHLLVVAVVEEDKLERVMAKEQRRLLQLTQKVSDLAAESTLSVAHSKSFSSLSLIPSTTLPVPTHYGWIGSPDLANSIVAEHLPLPTLLIIEVSPEQNHKYYVFNNRESIDSESKIQNLVELVKEGHFQATVHADSVSFKLYRYVFDAKVSLTDMWAGNPVLTIVLFGLPLGFLSLILYSACCGDIMDAKEEDEVEESEEEVESHEKRE
ncbi:Protein disulfide-isomerase TMX3 [Orchesella cincta]|uniref:Protein disulfide-isomerase TMX3 n=1 Tax=Orchesella cincta TaxID=48709 RepID=A0A1D2ME07_ORCCI|nr:Protein disulfide-isomerase TMX3 [Orchesella cincta]